MTYVPVWATAETDAAALGDELRALAARVRPGIDSHAQEELALPILRLLFGLGRSGGEPPPELGPRLPDLTLGLSMFMQDSRDQLLQEFRFGDQWLRALDRRSALQFLLDLFQLPAELRAELDPAELDDHLRRRGEVE